MKEGQIRNAGDEKQVKDSEAAQRRKREQELADLAALLKMPEGKRFIWRLLTTCGVYRLSFDHSGSITAFNEGKRNVGLQFLDDVMAANPDALVSMMRERIPEGA